MGESGPSVLVVDDERFFREAIQEALQADGFDCQLTGTAGEAVGLARDPRVGVVVLDIQLPDRNGLEVLRRLRDVRPEVRVVVLSAHTDQEYVLEALRLGACDYLAKPIHEEELRLSVRRALETYRVAAQSLALGRRLEGLAEVRRGLAQAAEEGGRDTLAGRVVEAAGRLLDAGRTSLLVLGDSDTELRVVAGIGHKLAPEQLDAVPLGGLVAGWVAARGEPLVVVDAARDPRLAGRPPTSGRYASASFVVVPVGEGVGRLGALCATDRLGGEPFGSADAALLGLLAEQLASLWVGGTRPLASPPELLLGESGAPEVEAEAGVAELARRICEAITSEVEPERLLTAALRAVGGQLAATPVAIHLAEPGDGPLVRQAQWEGTGASDRPRLPRHAGLTGGVFDTGQPVVTSRPADDPRFDPAVDRPEEGGEGGLLIVPLRFRGRTLGVCRAFFGGAEIPSPRVAEVLSAALSAAVRNVLLYRSLLASIEEVARARREARQAPGAA